MNVNAEPFVPGAARGSVSPGEHSSPLSGSGSGTNGGGGVIRMAVAGQAPHSPPLRRPSTGNSTIPFPKRPDCMFYVKGTCTKGDACLFRHNRLAKFGSQETCAVWERTLQCDDVNCPHLHPKMLNSPAGTPPVAVPFPPIPWTRRPDCMYFLRGMCNKGDKCVYRHNENARMGPKEVCPVWVATNGSCSDQSCMYIHPKLSSKEQPTQTGGSHPSTPTTGFAYSSLGFHSGTSSPFSPEKAGVSRTMGSFNPSSSAQQPQPAYYQGSPPLSTLQMRNALSSGRSSYGSRPSEFTFNQKRVPSLVDLGTDLQTFLNEIDPSSSPTLSTNYLRQPMSQSAQMLPPPLGNPVQDPAPRKMSFGTESQPSDSWGNQFSSQQLLYGSPGPIHFSAQTSPKTGPLQPLLSQPQSDEKVPFVRRNSMGFAIESQSGPGSLERQYPWILPFDDPSRKDSRILNSDSVTHQVNAVSEESPAAGGSDDEDDGTDGNTVSSETMSKDMSISHLLPATLKDEIQSSERSDEVSLRDDRSLDLSLDSPPFNATGAKSSDKAVDSGSASSNSSRLSGGSLHVKTSSISNAGSASGSSGSNRTDGNSVVSKAKDYRVPLRAMDSGMASDTSSCISGSGSDFTADSDAVSLSPLLLPPLPSDVQQMSFDEFSLLPSTKNDMTGEGLVKTVTATRMSSRSDGKTGASSSSSGADKKTQQNMSLWLLPANIINPLMTSRIGPSSMASSPLFVHVYSELAKLCDFSVHTKHKNIVPYIGFCAPPRDPFCLVSAFASPSTLFSRVKSLAKDGHNMSFAERVHVCTGVATALKIMHSHGIIHGSLSPMNVHVLTDRQEEHGHNLVQVSGYGILSVLSSYQHSSTASSSGKSPLAGASSSSGSSSSNGLPHFSALQVQDKSFLSFAAPEVLLPSLASLSPEPGVDAESDAASASMTPCATEKSDIYSFGVLMLFMLQDGVIPFQHQTSEQFVSTVENRVKSHSKTILSLPPTLQCEFGYAKLLDKCLRVNPDKRPANMDAILSTLTSFLS